MIAVDELGHIALILGKRRPRNFKTDRPQSCPANVDNSLPAGVDALPTDDLVSPCRFYSSKTLRSGGTFGFEADAGGLRQE